MATTKQIDSGKQLVRDIYADLEERPRFSNKTRTVAKEKIGGFTHGQRVAMMERWNRESAQMAAPSTETPERRNRRRVAGNLARVMRAAGIDASAARQGGLGAVTREQRLAQDCFRRAVAAKARCASGYIPSDPTWELACTMLEVAQ